MVARSSSVIDLSREEVLAEFARCAGRAADEPALRLALLAGLLTVGWRKALHVVEHRDEAARERRWADLEWWIREARQTLDSAAF
jgi:hypothetical protein